MSAFALSTDLSSPTPGIRSPRDNPGATVSNFERCSIIFPLILASSPSTPPDFTTSSRPPGRNGEFPDLPRTKARAAVGRRVNDVEVRPVIALGTRTCD